MAIYEFTTEEIRPVSPTRFGDQGLRERDDLQRLLRDRIDVVAPGMLVVAEEFGSFEDSQRRIDLLALDTEANLVVIELKRGHTGGHIELQAVRYAAMVSAMTFDQVVAAHETYLNTRGEDTDARQAILDFLEWDEPAEDDFAQDVRVVLVAADFSKELTTSVMWLNDHDVDVRCVRLKPYSLDGRVLVDVQQVIPLPEAVEYQVQVREKARKKRRERVTGRDLTKFDVMVDGRCEQRLPKRWAAFRLISALCESGVSPEEISAALPWGGNNTWRVAEGKLDAARFEEQLAAAAAAGGPAFQLRRWFCKDEELISHGGRTWALRSGWGRRTEEAFACLMHAFPNHGVSYARSEDEG